MRDFVSKRASNLKPSGIRKFFDLCAGSKDIISLGVGEPDFITPYNISEAGIRTIKRGRTQYTSNSGIVELREEISSYLKNRYNVDYDKEDIIITVGASEAIDIALRAVVDEGDEVLIPMPSYVSYAPCVELNGGIAVGVPCFERDNFKIRAKELKEKITSNSKVIILPYPNNPTGGIMEEEDYREIIDVIIENDLLVITDEIYSELTYGKRHFSIASIPSIRERTIYINGFSKAFAMTGWRVGYVCAPKEIKNAMIKIHQYALICAPIFSQYAALEGLRQEREDNYQVIENMKEEYDKRRKFMVNSFNEIGLHCFNPEGAFYVFPCVESTGYDGQEFAKLLLEKEKVAVVPGDAFGESGKNYIRCSYAYSMESLIKAMEKISKFVKEL